VTGDFRGTGSTVASARAELVEQVQEAWDEEWGMVNNRLLYSVGANSAWSLINATDIITANAGVLNASGNVRAGQTLTVHTGIYVQSGTARNWTSSLALAQQMSAEGIAFKELVLNFTRQAAGTYTFGFNDTGNFGASPWLASGATLTLAQVGSITTGTGTPGTFFTSTTATIGLRNQLNTYLNNGGANRGRLWYAPDTGPTALFAPTSAQINAGSISQVQSGIRENLTVTAEVAGETVELDTGRISQLDRNTTSLGTLISQTAKGLSRVLTEAQQAAAAPGKGLAGMGRIVARAATPTAGPTSIAQVEDLAESRRFVSGALERSVATGGYAFSGYSFSDPAGIGLTSAQLHALTRAGIDLSRLHLANPTVSASASSTVGSASARQLLVDKLNRLWNAMDFDSLSSLTVRSGVATGYDPLTGAAVMASAAGQLSGTTAFQATVAEGGTFVIHTGVYADARGNWTDEAAIASALGLQEVTYQVTNNRRTWVKMSADFVSTSWVSGSFAMTAGVAAQMAAAGFTGLGAGGLEFKSAEVRAVGSAHSRADASSQLYLDGLARWGQEYGDGYTQIGFTAGDNGASIGDFSYTLVNDYATTVITTDSGATDTIRDGQTLTVRTGIWVASGTTDIADGNWTDDRAIASALGMEQLIYQITNVAGPAGYTYTRALSGETAYAVGPFENGDELTLEQLGRALAADTRSFIDDKQGVGATRGKVYNGGVGGVDPPTPAKVANDISTNGGAGGVNYNEASRNNGVTNLDVTFTLSGQSYTGVTPYAAPITLAAGSTTMNQLAAAINTQFGQVLSGIQTIANVGGWNGVGRIVNALNTPPAGIIAISDVEGLTVEDIYKTAGSGGIIDQSRQIVMVASAGTASADARGVSNFGARALASAINNNAASQFWAMVQSVDSNGKQADMVYVFAKEGGNLNSLLACDVAGSDRASREGLDSVLFENAETARTNQSGTTFSLGGEKWGTMKPTQTKASLGTEVWNVTIEGRDVGKERDIWIANEGQLDTPALGAGIINGMNRDSFVEIQNAANADWAGGEIRTQSTAQEALDAITAAITAKDKIRADLGALQNRLENTMTNLTIQAENLQASESRISDVDVATEMTEFTRNNVLSQAATSMLAQANSLSQLALSLIR
jgi:flagellin-like hook-associated protein FlgL